MPTTKSRVDPFQALADHNRREILVMLSKKQLSINRLAENFDISRPAISKHIKILSDANLIQIENSGRERVCSLNEQGFDFLKEWIEHFDKFWELKLASLGEYLNKQKKGKKVI